jgi:uncharacterized Zn finger protein
VSKKIELKPCYKCGGETFIYIHGRVRGETASYVVECKNCGELVRELPTTGAGYRRGAIREYNRIYKREIRPKEEYQK